jgi:hypothetical protein
VRLDSLLFLLLNRGPGSDSLFLGEALTLINVDRSSSNLTRLQFYADCNLARSKRSEIRAFRSTQTLHSNTALGP